MSELRFALLGTGFWSRYQLAAWGEIEGVRCVALYNRTRSKAEALAAEFGVPTVYDDAELLLRQEQLDFVDIVTDADTHEKFTGLALNHRLPTICQKPMAPSLATAEAMARKSEDAGIPLLIHENWRWQAPLRRLKGVLQSGRLGPIVRARIDYANKFPVFDNQPFLRELERFILTDIGTHILDVARFLFGEATELYCQTRRMHEDIQGEDVATVMMQMDEGLTVTCNMSYASRGECDRFPETFAAIEGTHAGVSLGAGHHLTLFHGDSTEIEQVLVPQYAWADPAYSLIHASIVDCHRNLVAALRGEAIAETNAIDNLKTLRLVDSAYQSAAEHAVIRF